MNRITIFPRGEARIRRNEELRKLAVRRCGEVLEQLRREPTEAEQAMARQRIAEQLAKDMGLTEYSLFG